MSRNKQNITFKLWWIIPILVFDTLYFLFIQLLLLRPEERFLKNITFQWEAITFMVFASLISLYTIQIVQRFIKGTKFSIVKKYFRITIFSLLLFLVTVALLMFITEYLLGQQRNLNYVIGNAIIFIFHHLIIGNVFIAYLYLKESNELKQALIMSEKSKTELKLKALQQQMSPHFMFNNLNTLMSLIEPGQKETLSFTKSLASIYRYFTSHMGEDLVSLQDELAFIDHYFDLIKQRFGPAYRLNINSTGINTSELLLVPMSLQLVIENAIKHNKGNRNAPLEIVLGITEETITVKNDQRKKANLPANQGSGSGLKNLDQRCQLMMNRKLYHSIVDNNFIVEIPLVKHIQDESIGN